MEEMRGKSGEALNALNIHNSEVPTYYWIKRFILLLKESRRCISERERLSSFDVHCVVADALGNWTGHPGIDRMQILAQGCTDSGQLE